MNDNPFEIKEEACASSPDHRRYLLIQAVDTETGEIVWACLLYTSDAADE